MKVIDEERKLVSDKKTTILNGKKHDHDANGVEEGGDYVNDKIVDVDKVLDKEEEEDDGEDDEVDDEEDQVDDDDVQKVEAIEKENGEGEDDVEDGVEYDEDDDDDGPDSDDGDEDSDEDEDEDGEAAEYGEGVLEVPHARAEEGASDLEPSENEEEEEEEDDDVGRGTVAGKRSRPDEVGSSDDDGEDRPPKR